MIDQRIMRKYPHLSERLRKYILTVTGAEKNTDDQPMDEKEKLLLRVQLCLDIAGMMMNVTPDILILYRDGKGRHAKALECKYESDEGSYTDMAGVEQKMQIFIQECIMLFLFGKREADMPEDHYPPRPVRGSIWGKGEEEKKEEAWLTIFRRAYDDIVKQEIAGKGRTTNAGVRIIQFVPSGKRKKTGIEIEIKKLLKYAYKGEPEENTAEKSCNRKETINT